MINITYSAPWTVAEGISCWFVHNDKGHTVAQIAHPDRNWQVGKNTRNERLDNARLIAAAPCLLASLKDIVGNTEYILHDGRAYCGFCGRELVDNPQDATHYLPCTADDCPGVVARAAIEKAEAPHAP